MYDLYMTNTETTQTEMTEAEMLADETEYVVVARMPWGEHVQGGPYFRYATVVACGIVDATIVACERMAWESVNHVQVMTREQYVAEGRR